MYENTEITVRQDGIIETDPLLHRCFRCDRVNRREHKDEG